MLHYASEQNKNLKYLTETFQIACVDAWVSQTSLCPYTNSRQGFSLYLRLASNSWNNSSSAFGGLGWQV